ncbi:MAG TPA: imidazole glycerol phosphate synthase subunit HisH [Flavipsychrobacter sp.]|nr:imidazole glycerol phosphate synthase subunit HisH [Flavipsychrobacter sp.]
MKVVIIKYNTGNICSVDFSLQRVGINAFVTDDASEILSADKVILPGVGAAAPAMSCLKEKNLDKLIRQLQQPLLGICLGMQLLCDFSEEGNTECLGIFKDQVKKFTSNVKTPHVGWNNVTSLRSQLFRGVNENEFMYFVHSYFVGVGNDTTATTDYDGEYSAALQKDNFYAVQFHPEKSGVAGQKILENFIRL